MRYIILVVLLGCLVNNALAQQEESSIFQMRVKDRYDTISLPRMEFKITDLTAKYSFSAFSDSFGLAVVKVARNHVYLVYSSDPKEEYYDSEVDTIIADSMNKMIVITADYMNVNYVFELPVIYFEKKSIQLTEREKYKIDSFTAVISKYKRIIIEVAGYASDLKTSEGIFIYRVIGPLR